MRHSSVIGSARKCIASLALAILVLTLCPAPSRAGVLLVLPHEKANPGRKWTWQAIMNSMGAIQSAGYSAILISPHEAACGGDQSVGYDPYDFQNFNSAHGTQQQLQQLVKKVHQAGLQIYADMIMNHMCSNNFHYPHFGPNDFHHFGAIQNWDDQWQLENGSLFGLEDLSQESPYVRGQLFDYLVKTNNMGFDGYRWDAVKHVPQWFWKDHIVNNVNAWGKYNFGEVFDGNRDHLSQYVETGMAVTDYSLYFAIRDSFKFGGNLAALDGAGLAAINGAKALTFVENHDVPPPPNGLLAYAFIAAYPGYPSFFNVALTDAKLNNLVWVHDHLASGDLTTRYKDQDTLVFERAGNLLAGINQKGEWVSKWVQTSWPNRRLHDYSGNVNDTSTEGSGWVEIWIPPTGYVMMAP
jgi:alpha-amylase